MGRTSKPNAAAFSSETVAYVGNIVKYYTVYRGIAEQEEARKAARSLMVAR